MIKRYSRKELIDIIEIELHETVTLDKDNRGNTVNKEYLETYFGQEFDEDGITEIADNVLKTFNAINDIESQFPKIANIANVKVDWDRHEDVEEIVKVLVQYTKNMQEEILTSWKESNPKSAINELF